MRSPCLPGCAAESCGHTMLHFQQGTRDSVTCPRHQAGSCSSGTSCCIQFPGHAASEIGSSIMVSWTIQRSCIHAHESEMHYQTFTGLIHETEIRFWNMFTLLKKRLDLASIENLVCTDLATSTKYHHGQIANKWQEQATRGSQWSPTRGGKGS